MEEAYSHSKKKYNNIEAIDVREISEGASKTVDDKCVTFNSFRNISSPLRSCTGKLNETKAARPTR